jgi:hypothetical protein
MASASPAALLLDVAHGPAALALSAPLAMLSGLHAPAAVQHVLGGGASGSAAQQPGLPANRMLPQQAVLACHAS